MTKFTITMSSNLVVFYTEDYANRKKLINNHKVNHESQHPNF